MYFTIYISFLQSRVDATCTKFAASRLPHLRPQQQVIRSSISCPRTVAMLQKSLSRRKARLLLKPLSQSERRQGVGASRCIRLALKCFYGRRSRVGFNGRLRGFRWIISGGTGKKRRSVAAVLRRCRHHRRAAVVAQHCCDAAGTLAYAPLSKSRDKEGRLHDYT